MNAIEIVSQKTVGIHGSPPHEHGNCFTVMTDYRLVVKVLNFCIENLNALLELGLTWPIELKRLDGNCTVIHDTRIGERWYQQRWCELCCPKHLLPIQQVLRHEREVKIGRRKVSGPYITIDTSVKPEFD